MPTPSTDVDDQNPTSARAEIEDTFDLRFTSRGPNHFQKAIRRPRNRVLGSFDNPTCHQSASGQLAWRALNQPYDRQAVLLLIQDKQRIQQLEQQLSALAKHLPETLSR